MQFIVFERKTNWALLANVPGGTAMITKNGFFRRRAATPSAATTATAALPAATGLLDAAAL